MISKEIQVYTARELPIDKTILIFSPHPDDTSISAGGTALLLSKKNRVVSVVMTTGHRAKIKNLSKEERMALREKEAKDEGKLLGAEVVFLKLPLYDAQKITKEDREKLHALFETTRPDLIFLPNEADPHPTHHLCAKLILETVREWTALHPMTIDLWYYESPWSLFNREDFNAVVSLPSAIFEKKIKAIRAHTSQNERTPYDVIATSLAQMRGAIVGEQSLAGYGDTAPKLDPYVELFSVVSIGRDAKLVESLSGIRGVFRKGLTSQTAYDYGYAYGNWLKHTLHVNPKVIVGIDTRRSGPLLKKSLMEGLTRAHCHIFDVGVATTPLVQFEVRNRKCDGGVMITASHNEPEWNGFKFFWQDGSALLPEQMQAVIASVHAESKEAERPHVEHYIQFLLDWIGPTTVAKIRAAKLKVVVDPNGGAMIVVLKKIFDLLEIETIGLNMEPGAFAHSIEPTTHSLKEMAPAIQKHRADLGVSWDCDGDRVEIVLPGGQLLSGHYILALVVDQVLKKSPPRQTVVINGATSGIVSEVAKRHGATIIETDVGETNVVDAMKKTKAIVGGEGSNGGGIIPPSRCRDGMMTLLKILELVVEEGKPLAELLKNYPRYYTRAANVTIDLSSLASLKNEIQKLFEGTTVKIIGGEQGGMKLVWEDGTFLWIRVSKTERNLVRLLVDSSSLEKTEAIFQKATEKLLLSVTQNIS